jgi:hypothetical protein
VSVDRNELHELVDALPDDQLPAAGDELRRRLPQSAPDGAWPPEFFNVIDGTEVPTDVAANVDLYLAAYGFGSDSL